MRNLKRVLSLALALVMVLGMMVITTSAADFTDADEITYTEAMDVMAGVGLYKGDENGNVNPGQTLTREDAATLMARIILGDKIAGDLAPTKQIFTDVATDRWSAAAIEYCYNIGMIVGYTDAEGNLVFNPKGQLTGTAFAKLLLCALGYDAGAEGYEGGKWSENINADALAADLMIKGENIADPLSRESAAQMILQALPQEMVEYTTAYDYATGAAVLVGPFDAEDGDTFQTEYFSDLKKVTGTITNTTASAGKTTIAGVTLSNTEADWTTVGYAARAWYLNSSKKAVSLIVTGKDISVTTDGTTVAAMVDPDDDAYVADLNTVYDATTDKDVESVVYVLNGNTSTKAKVAAAADEIGAKVALVNNDKDDAIESVVVTTYTAAKVTDVNKKSASGVVSVYSYDLDSDATILVKDLANVDSLTKGGYIAYTEVDGKYYVTDLEVAEGEYEYTTRDKLNNETVKVYTIDGVGYLQTQMGKTEIPFLTYANTNKDVVYVVDMYGYLVRAYEPAAAASSYLFVIDNEHDSVLTGLAETLVAYADGSVEIVDVKKDVVDSGLKNEIYTYTVKNGAYVLTDKNATELTVAKYDNKTTKMTTDKGSIALTGVTIVDLRDYLAGDADEGVVYTGYKEIPSFVNGTIYYLASAKLGFMVDGEDPTAAANLSASFVIFDTKVNDVDIDEDGNYIYELEKGVLIDGEVVYDFYLSQTQKEAVDALGVGAYEFNKDGSLKSYTTFEDDTIYWTPEDYGTLIKNDKDVTDDYKAVFLNIAEGEVNDWYLDVEEGEYFCWIDDSDKDNLIVYIVADGTSKGDKEIHVYYAKNAEVVTVLDGVAYYSAEGHVTNKTTQKLDAAMEKAAENDLIAYVYANGAFSVVDASDNVVGYGKTYDSTVSVDGQSTTFVGATFTGANAVNWGTNVGDVEFIGCTFDCSTKAIHIDTFAAGGSLRVENCVIESGNVQIASGADSVEFIGCEFNTENTAAWTDCWIRIYSDATFEDCSFSEGIKILPGTADLTLTLINCTQADKAVSASIAYEKNADFKDIIIK